jgi:predicted metal-dependent HD superfamily phosphohydrolase
MRDIEKRFEDLMTAQFHQTYEVSKVWWQKISYYYSEPHRHYHTLTHLRHMFELYDTFENDIQNKAVVILSVIFHDIIYDPRSSSNEEDSVDLFKLFVKEISDSSLDEIHEHVIDFILATKSHVVDWVESETIDDSLRNDKLFFLAFDMAILSADPREYNTYAANVRKEYIHVDHETYCTRRAAFLRGVLAGGPVFYGKLGPDAEAKMQQNLIWESENLEKGIIPE